MSSSSDSERLVSAIWESAIPAEESGWVERVASLPLTGEPLGDHGDIVRDMLKAGVPAATIARFARIVAYEATFSVLYELDGEACPGGHEVLLTSDPTGREMRPPAS